MRWPFRALAWILGPALTLGGFASLGLLLYGLWTEGKARAWSWSLFSLGIGVMSLGLLLMKAAWTGRDPYHQEDEEPEEAA